MKESLSEEELAIFDLLLKNNLDPAEREKVKKVSKDLLAKLKIAKLVLDWREKESSRAGVKTEIEKVLYDGLPEPVYTETECKTKGLEVYNFIYEHYKDGQNYLVG
jgi:type I restriction enzyme R subunit